MTSPGKTSIRLQTIVGAGVILLGLSMAMGALSIPSAAGYAGVGPNFLPWLVSIALMVCGGFMVYEARTGGFRDMGDPPDTGQNAQPYWGGFAWMSAGLLANAALITTLGFILSCTLCFVLAARGMRNAEGQTGDAAKTWLAVTLRDTVTGLLIAAPVFWMFTKFLAINLPGLTQTGWL